MNIYYVNPHDKKNFGDQINEWIWSRVLSCEVMKYNSGTICGIGSILNNTVPIGFPTYVIGSGVGYGVLPSDHQVNSWVFLCVRGPLSAKVLGLNPEKAVTDSAILIRNLPEYQPISPLLRTKISFMPHYEALNKGNWQKICDELGLQFLDPTKNEFDLLEKIKYSKLVIADAMHAAIVADALRVPWVPVRTSPQINSFKWIDWTMSMNLPYVPFDLGQSSFTEKVRAFFTSFYGENHTIDSRDIDEVIASYKNMVAFRSNKFSALYTKVIRILGGFAVKALRSTMKLFPKDSSYEVAKKRLTIAAKSPGYLSDENILNLRLHDINTLLESHGLTKSKV